MSSAPDQIVQCLDQLELVSDNPMALKLVAELRVRLNEWAQSCIGLDESRVDEINLLQEKVDDLVCQLEAICREPV